MNKHESYMLNSPLFSIDYSKKIKNKNLTCKEKTHDIFLNFVKMLHLKTLT